MPEAKKTRTKKPDAKKVVKKTRAKESTRCYRVYVQGRNDDNPNEHTAIKCYDARTPEEASDKAKADGIIATLVKPHQGKVGPKGEPIDWKSERGIDPRGRKI